MSWEASCFRRFIAAIRENIVDFDLREIRRNSGGNSAANTFMQSSGWEAVSQCSVMMPFVGYLPLFTRNFK
jgi:hypothetical protein